MENSTTDNARPPSPSKSTPTPSKTALHQQNGSSSSPNSKYTFLGDNGVKLPLYPQYPWPGDIKRDEVVRLMLQTLHHLGFEHSVATLEQEANVEYESSDILNLRYGILKGDWRSVEDLIDTLGLEDPKAIQTIKFLVRQQKYLQLVANRNVKEALDVLRDEISPVSPDTERLHLLSSLLMCSSPTELQKKANWDGYNDRSRLKLLADIQKHLPPALMISDYRMVTLFEEAQKLQQLSCLYHNTQSTQFSLYTDHVCNRNLFPNVVSHTFEDHMDEVWYVAFSHNGKYLGSASKDATAKIWSIENSDCFQTLIGHDDPVSFLAWSPNDQLILTCGNDHKVKLWAVSVLCPASFVAYCPKLFLTKNCL